MIIYYNLLQEFQFYKEPRDEYTSCQNYTFVSLWCTTINGIPSRISLFNRMMFLVT